MREYIPRVRTRRVESLPSAAYVSGTWTCLSLAECMKCGEKG